MPRYLVVFEVEGDVADDTEEILTWAMQRVGFGKTAFVEIPGSPRLPKWCYEGTYAGIPQDAARAMRDTARQALGEELNVVAVPSDQMHYAHTTGSLQGIQDLDPEVN